MVERSTRSPIPSTILRDTREQEPWTFDAVPVETRDVTLATGDYAVPAHCRHDPELDTYYPAFAIERKSGQDFLTSITWQRDRFASELERAAEWTQPFPVLVEASWRTLLLNRGCMARRDVHPAQVAGTVAAWTRHYNVAFHFADTRQRATLCGFLLLVRYSLTRQLNDAP